MDWGGGGGGVPMDTSIMINSDNDYGCDVTVTDMV